jgi:hypothetical protein
VAVVLKLSPNRQLTLTKAIVEAMGSPSYFEAELVKRELILRPGLKLTLDEADLRFGKHGITREVLTEALRIVAKRETGES